MISKRSRLKDRRRLKKAEIREVEEKDFKYKSPMSVFVVNQHNRNVALAKLDKQFEDKIETIERLYESRVTSKGEYDRQVSDLDVEFTALKDEKMAMFAVEDENQLRPVISLIREGMALGLLDVARRPGSMEMQLFTNFDLEGIKRSRLERFVAKLNRERSNEEQLILKQKALEL